MAEGEPDFVTLHEYYAHRQRQDDDIRKAFESHATLIESSNQQLRDDLNATFNNRLSSVNGALGGKLKGLQDELGKVKQDLRHLKDEVGQVKDEVGEIKARLNQMEGRSFNNSRFLPWHNLSTIGIYKPDVGFTLPEYFPSTI